MKNWAVKSTKVLMVGLIVIALLFFGGITYYSLIRLNRSRPTELVVEGKQIWNEKSCFECHTILGMGSYLSSDLTHSVSQIPLENIRSFLLESPEIISQSNMRHPDLESEEVEAIIDFLAYVDQVNIHALVNEFINFDKSIEEKDNSIKTRNIKEK